MPDVGLIGVGIMGSAFAGHLLAAGFTVTGYDTDPARLRALVERGGRAAGTCAAVARVTDLIITSLPSVTAFEEVSAALAAVVREPAAVADTSTLPLDVKERARDRLAARRVPLLDCPVSGTGRQALERDIAVYASGDPATLARFAPVFGAFARTWHEVGPFGAGSTLKFVANHLVAVHNAAAAEALLLASRAGLDPGRVLDLLDDGAGSSRMLRVRGPLMASGDYTPGVRTQVMRKDIEIITDFARAHGTAIPLLAAATRLYDTALELGRGEQDPACLYEVLADEEP